LDEAMAALRVSMMENLKVVQKERWMVAWMAAL